MTRHGSLAERRGDEINHANDNYKVGAGNLVWHVPQTPDMTHDEVSTLSSPLSELQRQIYEAEGFISKSTACFSSVYVISDIYGVYTKIGVANTPTNRLAQLQTGNPSKLFIHRLFWLFCDRYKVAEIALSIEKDAHILAERLHYRAVGEWFKCSPTDAACVVELEIVNHKESGHITKYCSMTPPRDIWRP